jgi:hypothetical protein
MKKIFTFVFALLSMFATTQLASAATGVFNVTVPTGTNQCWIMGNFAGTVTWPITAAIQCTKVDDTHYTVTLDDATFLEGITLATLQYKYLSGPGDWAYVEKDAVGAEISNRTFLGSPQIDVVATWASVFTPHVPQPMNVTIDVLVPAGTVQCYIVGNFNNWAGPTAPVDSCKMKLISTNDDGTMVFEKTVYTADAVLLAYHFCSGPDWSFEQKDPTGDYHYPFVAPVVNTWKLIYDPSKLGTLNFTVTVPTGTAAVWAIGSFEGWDLTKALACTKNADGTFSFSVPMVMSIEYKMYNQPDWNHSEMDPSDPTKPIANNRAASFPADANASITVSAWAAAPSALQEINANKYKVYTFNNSIVVEGVTSQVTIFDVSGRKIQSAKLAGKFSSKALNSGLYILLVDGATKKVAVN